MIDIIYPIFIIHYISKQKKTGFQVSKFTTFTAYSFLIISLIRIAFGSLGLFLFSIPIFGFLYFAVIGEILFHISIIYGIILLFLSFTLFLDSQKSNQELLIMEKNSLYLLSTNVKCSRTLDLFNISTDTFYS